MIIGITGTAGSGKDTVGNMLGYFLLGKNLEEVEFDYDTPFFSPLVKIKKLAEPVKKISAVILDKSVLEFEDREFKESYIDWLGITVRELMQKVGTECFRDVLDQDIWVKYLLKDYNDTINYPVHDLKTLNDLYSHASCKKCGKHYLGFKRQLFCSNCAQDLKQVWIVTDVRFPNEVKAIKELGGEIIKVRREKAVNTHISESFIDELNADFVILNTGGIPELARKVEKLYNEYFSEIL